MTLARDFFKIGPARLFVHFVVLVIVILWLIPTLGIFISALRDKDQLVVSGWWTAFAGSSRTVASRLGQPDQQKQEGATYVIAGNVLEGQEGRSIKAFGTRVQQPAAYSADETADLGDGVSLLVNSDGSYRYTKNAPFGPDDGGRRVYVSIATPPEFTMQNYRTVLTGEGIGQSFINSLTVTIPATIIPILIAAFAAYALSWMEFPGRALLIALVVGLIVVPLQMSLIPLLRLYNMVGAAFDAPSKTYLGIWLAHTAFGMPLAIYLLRAYIAGLPKEIIESARVDGASDFEIFVRIVLPLSFPHLRPSRSSSSSGCGTTCLLPWSSSAPTGSTSC